MDKHQKEIIVNQNGTRMDKNGAFQRCANCDTAHEFKSCTYFSHMQDQPV